MTLLGIESDIGIFGSMVINDLEWLGERIMHAENTKDRIEHWIAFEVSDGCLAEAELGTPNRVPSWWTNIKLVSPQSLICYATSIQ